MSTDTAPSGAAPRLAATRDSLKDDLARLGLRSGDTVLVRADVGEVGRVRGGVGEGLMGALRDAVGRDGTLLALSFTRTFPLWRLDRSYVFEPRTPPTSGALARLFVEDPHAVRSRHPTNSFVALGPRAARLLEGHDAGASSFEPMGRLLELGGRQLLIGCAESSPGFTTVHWAQHVLGLDRRSLLRGRFGVLYAEGGEVRLFRRRDFGGCSRGFSRFYADYVRAGVLRTGTVGKAYSLLVDARAAFELERRRLERDPRFALCGDRLCPWCRGSWLYNKRDMLLFYPRFSLRGLRDLLARRAASAGRVKTAGSP